MQRKCVRILVMSMEINLLDVDNLVQFFIKDHEKGICMVHKHYFRGHNPIALPAFIVELSDELKRGCISFINKNGTTEDINSYLFYIVNSFCKNKSFNHVKKKIEYLCPGCLIFNRKTILKYSKVLECDLCEDKINSATNANISSFFKTFAKHNKNGYSCEDCDRFIPHPLDKVDIIACPYFDCYFVGPWEKLKKAHHPTVHSNPEKLILDSSGSFSMKDSLVSCDTSVDIKVEIQQSLQNKIDMLKDIIESQINNVVYNSSEFTVNMKIVCYQAYLNLIEKYPIEMVEYLLHNSRSGGFQHKIFQEYINLLEETFPYSFRKNGKPYKIESLLDPELKLFDGISVFDSVVTDSCQIKNDTKEFYIGGRKAAYTKPYYIGKLLNIVDKQTKNCLLDNVKEYSFSKIKMRDIEPGTKVIVTHLRVPPHYQMGGMVYVNRLRKKIVERATSTLVKEYNA